MKRIIPKIQHEKIVFEIEGEELLFVDGRDFLGLLDRQKVHDTLEGLKPENRFAELNRIESVAMYEILKSRKVPADKIAKKLKIASVGVMDEWVRTGFIEKIKEERKGSLAAMLRGLDQYSTKSLLDDRIT